MKVEPASIETVTTSPHSPDMAGNVSPPQMDHDYATLYTLPGGQTATIIKQESGKAWIEQDAPPMVRFQISFSNVSLLITVRCKWYPRFFLIEK